MTVINAIAAANKIIAEQNNAVAVAHAALTHARIELGAMLLLGARADTKHAFETVCAALDKIEGREQMTDRDTRYREAMAKVYAIIGNPERAS
jgi:hypothetical protein